MHEFKISDFFFPLGLARVYFLLLRSEHWSNNKIQRYQARKLVSLLRHCAADVPYYRELFGKIGLRKEDIDLNNAFRCLKEIPVLDKDTFRVNSDLFLARNAGRHHPKPVTTSGTTGTPLIVHWDRKSNIMEFCCMQRLWRWVGFRIGQCFLDIRSRTFSSNENYFKHHDDVSYIRNWKVNNLEFNSDLINENNIIQYYKVLLKHKPRLVRGHPQAIQHLLSMIRKNGLEGWTPVAVTTTSETLYDFQRNDIQKALGVTVLDYYGLYEHNVFIAQCRRGEYHIYPEYGICEILNDNGNPVLPGQEGWIVGTGLHNYAQPLIRYNTRDRAIAGSDEPSICGRTLPSVKSIIGRIDDCIYTRDGKRYSGMHFIFYGCKGIQKARLIQDDIDHVTVEMVITPEFDETEKMKIFDGLSNKVRHMITFDLKVVDNIVQEEPGKFKFVVSTLSDNWKKYAT